MGPESPRNTPGGGGSSCPRPDARAPPFWKCSPFSGLRRFLPSEDIGSPPRSIRMQAGTRAVRRPKGVRELLDLIERDQLQCISMSPVCWASS
eukprot:2435053-Pyramimonas_sp.AAC.1